MEIVSGLLQGQVLQRNHRNIACASFKGRCEADGNIEARVLKGTKPLPGLDWTAVGTAAKGRFSAKLTRIPVGGAYRVEVRISAKGKTAESLTLKDIFVGDVWFMAGQSNMQGVGNMVDAPKPHPMVRCFFLRDEWGMAEDPLHYHPEAVDEIHLRGNPRDPDDALTRSRRAAQRGAGVGIHFGIEMYKRSHVPQGLVSCADGGTCMAQWSPDKKKLGGKSLYGAMLRRFKKLGQPVRGVLWYQGCSDAHAQPSTVYIKRMKALVASTRKDFGLPNLPWMIVQISRWAKNGDATYWNAIQDMQRQLPDTVKHLEVVPAIDLELTDWIHIGAKSFPRLAVRLARMADRLAYGNKKEPGSIRLKKIKLCHRFDGRKREHNVLEIEFANVVGGLRSMGRPTGFCAVQPTGQLNDVFFNVVLDGNKVILEIPGEWTNFANGIIGYGMGFNPYVNITDARDMAVPAFGPISLS